MERLLTVQEVAGALQRRQETVRLWIKRGQLPATCLPDGDYRMREQDVDAILRPVAAGQKLEE